jgi:hypothetical protein
MNRPRQGLNGVLAAVMLVVVLAGCSDSQSRADEPAVNTGTPSNAVPSFPKGDFRSPLTFSNPYAHIPAQCHIETSRGTQNACLFCHTNGVYRRGLGNNFPQAGAEPRLGNLQLDYSFTPISLFTASPSRNPWENTLTPEKLREAVAALGVDPQTWDMEAYLREDNWRAAFRQRPGDPRDWDGGGGDAPFRLFPGLDPADLPADADGFVRSGTPRNGLFQDGDGRWITGWRAVNFMPYGIFTPMTGSVSGIYLRCPNRSCSARTAVSIWPCTPATSTCWSGRFRIACARRTASFIRARPGRWPSNAACTRSARKSPIPCITWT